MSEMVLIVNYSLKNPCSELARRAIIPPFVLAAALPSHDPIADFQTYFELNPRGTDELVGV